MLDLDPERLTIEMVCLEMAERQGARTIGDINARKGWVFPVVVLND